MVFSDAIFCFLFLPVAFLFFVLPKVARVPFLLLVSLAFYFYGSGLEYLFILIFSVCFNFVTGRILYSRKLKIILATCVIVNILVLVYFKYIFFFALNFDAVFSTNTSFNFKNIVLPIGISFFTFQAISFNIDIWRKEVVSPPKFQEFGAYLTFFPQLIAGPIVRYKDVVDDFKRHETNTSLFAQGAQRFGHGLAKKVLIADQAGVIADAVFAMPAGSVTTTDAWFGAIAYTIQIYFDFSAYSDMAIGLGRMFGIRMLENFDRPYSSKTITEFWRRWHISLSSWFRDYLYIPLGGNRGSTAKLYRNLFIVFLVTGMWHGAQWTFILWGIYHGLFIVFERVIWGKKANSMPQRWLRYAYCLPATVVGWILFRATSLPQAWEITGGLIPRSLSDLTTLSPDMVVALSPLNMLSLAAGMLIFFVSGKTSVGQRIIGTHDVLWKERAWQVYGVLALLAASTWTLTSDFSPFLYFQF